MRLKKVQAPSSKVLRLPAQQAWLGCLLAPYLLELARVQGRTPHRLMALAAQPGRRYRMIALVQPQSLAPWRRHLDSSPSGPNSASGQPPVMHSSHAPLDDCGAVLLDDGT